MMFGVEYLESGELLARVRRLTRQDQRTTAELVAHLGELDARELYASEGFRSPFAYCVQVLHYSEATAYRRIIAGRASRRFPVILDRIADGSIHLTGICLLAPHLTADNHLALLESARHRTRRQIERLVASITPGDADHPRTTIVPLMKRSPERAVVARRVDESAPAASPAPATLTLFDGPPDERADAPGNANSRSIQSPLTRGPEGPDTAAPTDPGGIRSDHPARTAAGESLPSRPTAPGAPDPEGWYRLHVTISETTRGKLERAQELMRHINPDGDVAPILDRALAALIVVLERRKFGRKKADVEGLDRGVVDARIIADAASADSVAVPSLPQPGQRRRPPRTSRRIAAAVRRAVWRRDAGRCTFVGTDGRVCGTADHLEYHHIIPWSRGGSSLSPNLTLRCRTHNAHESTSTLGRPARTFTGESDRSRPGLRSRPSSEAGTPARPDAEEPGTRGTGLSEPSDSVEERVGADGSRGDPRG